MMEWRFETSSEEQTVDLGRALARVLPARCLILLSGDLGAGKTTLTKGIVEGLGAAAIDDVSSPTFTLIHEYGQGRVYHIDLYRLEEPDELRALGLDEIFERDAAVLIEWGERFEALMPRDRIIARIALATDGGRSVAISGLPSHADPPAELERFLKR